jgi:leucyl aminopeptidase
MPLWDGYDDEIGSRIADLNNAPSSGLGGSITAALFLRRFVTDPARWIHLDLYGWNGKDRPGRPLGAEAQCVRAVAGLLQQRYA